MFLLYVDESGDVGRAPGASPHFILSGLVVHELRWQATLDAIVDLRRNLKARYGLKLREEIHASDLIRHPGDLQRIPKWRRLVMLRDVLDFEAQLVDVSVINVVVNKQRFTQGDVFERAWAALVQRFHNTIAHKNFPGPQNPDERGLLVTDATDGTKLRQLVRRMRHHNPIPNQSQYGTGYRQIPITTIVEDPVPRDSRQSYFLQLCDVNAYLLHQKEAPNAFFRKRGARNYFDRLGPILCKVASPKDPHGVVRI